MVIHVFLMLHFHRYDGQSIQEKHKVDFLVIRAKVKMWAEANPVLLVMGIPHAVTGTRLGVIKLEMLAAHVQALTDNQP